MSGKDKQGRDSASNADSTGQAVENDSGTEEQDQALSDQAEVDGSEDLTGESGEVGSMNARLEEALAEADKYRDVALRAEAEMRNVRRRAGLDVENAHRFALERFVNKLLPVVDSLEKALESVEQTDAVDETTRAIAEGVGLCQKMFVDVLEKEGVAVVDPIGEPFDPNLHQAMSMVENSDVEPSSVVAVIQRGYTLNERLIRPAMVMVSKASEAKN